MYWWLINDHILINYSLSGMPLQGSSISIFPVHIFVYGEHIFVLRYYCEFFCNIFCPLHNLLSVCLFKAVDNLSENGFSAYLIMTVYKQGRIHQWTEVSVTDIYFFFFVLLGSPVFVLCVYLCVSLCVQDTPVCVPVLCEWNPPPIPNGVSGLLTHNPLIGLLRTLTFVSQEVRRQRFCGYRILLKFDVNFRIWKRIYNIKKYSIKSGIYVIVMFVLKKSEILGIYRMTR